MCLSNSCVYVRLPGVNNIYFVHYTFQSEKDCDVRKWEQILVCFQPYSVPPIMIFLVCTVCRVCSFRFKGMCCLHLQGDWVQVAAKAVLEAQKILI